MDEINNHKRDLFWIRAHCPMPIAHVHVWAMCVCSLQCDRTLYIRFLHTVSFGTWVQCNRMSGHSYSVFTAYVCTYSFIVFFSFIWGTKIVSIFVDLILHPLYTSTLSGNKGRLLLLCIQFLLFKYLSVSVRNGSLSPCALCVNVGKRTHTHTLENKKLDDAQAWSHCIALVFACATATSSIIWNRTQATHRTSKSTLHTHCCFDRIHCMYRNLFNSCCLLSAAVAVVVCWMLIRLPLSVLSFRSLPLHDLSSRRISLHWTHIGLTSFVKNSLRKYNL